jgi:hypothetical protein
MLPSRLPTGVLGCIAGLLMKIAPMATNWIGMGKAPRLVMDLANPVDKGSPGRLEWLHLTLENEGQRWARRTATAREVHATVVIRDMGFRRRLM